VKPVFPNLFAEILVSRVFLILEHGIPGVMILKYGHVFLGQDTGNPPTHGFEPDQKGKNKRLKSREV